MLIVKEYTMNPPKKKKNIYNELILTVMIIPAMTKQTKNLRFAFTNARSGPVDFSRPLRILREKCEGLRHLDLTFTTDSLVQTKRDVEMETFNGVFLRECLAIVKELSSHNQIQTLKLLMCNKQILQQISKCSKLTVLEITEASVCEI